MSKKYSEHGKVDQVVCEAFLESKPLDDDWVILAFHNTLPDVVLGVIVLKVEVYFDNENDYGESFLLVKHLKINMDYRLLVFRGIERQLIKVLKQEVASDVDNIVIVGYIPDSYMSKRLKKLYPLVWGNSYLELYNTWYSLSLIHI